MDVRTRPPQLALWGGVECSVVRIGDRVRDQVVETGHHLRGDDLLRIAQLGIKTVRYPVIWEKVSPARPEHCNWAWHDNQMRRMRDLSLRPIVGLVHHGSGPDHSQFLAGRFSEGLAVHARNVAERYPWVNCYTPVNEPLTTARFSMLYGLWHPHLCDHDAFLRTVVEQCIATILSMSAIKTVNKDALLVQTEDIGRIFSTPRLRYQANYENERRWLSLDLLCGRVERDHPFYRTLVQAGVSERELAFIRDSGPVVDVIGMNHYLTSDRYLDERLSLFPRTSHGGNGRDCYADIEAFRADLPDAELGPGARLSELWARYGLPIAVTEVHNGAAPDEQARWLMEVWQAATELRSCGADVRAVTVWSMFGAVDWNSLLTAENGHYETGVFDIGGKSLRPTLLAEATTALATSGSWHHASLANVGWWRQSERVLATLRDQSRRCASGSSEKQE
ncbi:hypothetical protein LAC81_35110 (plasmid) [Ensifer adhaerens]|nr:hypothetical protein LAC78_36410 [Ensifer adhaerens]UAY05774.1 hypothetical protein LAC80_35115 [Ensifer adhaerens]UAY13152.1 hypothetical protein LAC81_35110 [Ensifer adhaerens]